MIPPPSVATASFAPPNFRNHILLSSGEDIVCKPNQNIELTDKYGLIHVANQISRFLKIDCGTKACTKYILKVAPPKAVDASNEYANMTEFIVGALMQQNQATS